MLHPCRGGKVAWTVAHMHQNMIERLIIISAPHPTSWTKNFSPRQAVRCVTPARSEPPLSARVPGRRSYRGKGACAPEATALDL